MGSPSSPLMEGQADMERFTRSIASREDGSLYPSRKAAILFDAIDQTSISAEQMISDGFPFMGELRTRGKRVKPNQKKSSKKEADSPSEVAGR